MRTTQKGGADPGPAAVIRVSVITPIVFCASLVPCASATVDAETTCPNLNAPVHPEAPLGADGEAVGGAGGGESDHGGQERRDQRRQHDLPEDGGEMDRVRSRGRERGTDQSAEQRVGRAGRHGQQPGQQIPQNGSDEPGEDDGRGDPDLVDQAPGDGLRDLDGQECACQVENSRDSNRDPRSERSVAMRWPWRSPCRESRS